MNFFSGTGSSGGSSGGSSSGGSNNGSWIPNAVVSAGSGIAGLFGRKKAFKRSKQLMQHQLDLSKEMWQYQNDYNTPARQMQRLRDAGLNPALMYGQGTTGNAQGAPQAQYNDLAPYSSPAEHAQSVASGVQMSLANAQKRNIESQTALNSITGAVKSGEFGIAKEMSKYQMSQLEADTELKRQQATKVWNETDLIGYERARKGLENEKLGYEVELYRNNYQEWSKSEYAKWGMNVVEYEAKKAKLNLTKEQIRQVKHKIWQDWVNAGSGIMASSSFIANAIKSLTGKKPKYTRTTKVERY